MLNTAFTNIFRDELPVYKLKKRLLHGREKSFLTTKDSSNKLKVSLLLLIARIDKLSEKDQELTSYLWLSLSWKDDTLKWNPSSYGNITTFTTTHDTLWIPEMIIRNTKEQPIDIGLEQKRRVRVFSDGSVSWSTAMIVRTHCDIDMTNFPWDVQVCHVEFSTMTYQKDIQYVPAYNEVSRQAFKKNPQWNLIKTKLRTYDMFIKIGDHNGTGTVAYATFILARQSRYYTMIIVVPSFVIIIVTGFTLLLPFKSGEKVSLNITVLLSYTMLLILMSSIMPENSLNFPILALHLVLNMIMSGIILISTVCHQRLYFTSPDKPLPKMIDPIALVYLSQIWNFVTCSKTKPPLNNMNSKVSSSLSVTDAVNEYEENSAQDKSKNENVEEEDAIQLHEKKVQKGISILENYYFVFYMLLFFIYITVVFSNIARSPGAHGIDDKIHFSPAYDKEI
ncbi:DgyrCDS1015 [Dimorphilus gyrociliatus]|uniref:DgyrCDS1015 n=1 Tax=Dimorphilus gyrociliatus TaxID=2664684 RepID=A0A7I8VB14_9ANNE|nr:DgyrCDS1015 [Dimorphilus gyrociliatus]